MQMKLKLSKSWGEVGTRKNNIIGTMDQEWMLLQVAVGEKVEYFQ